MIHYGNEEISVLHQSNYIFFGIRKSNYIHLTLPVFGYNATEIHPPPDEDLDNFSQLKLMESCMHIVWLQLCFEMVKSW